MLRLIGDRSFARGRSSGTGHEPHRSLWLQEALGDAPDAEPLRGAQRADVAIVGGGYVGLWTAIKLKRREPAVDVVVVEQDVCGGGASGRNGGQLHGWWERLEILVRLFGEEEGVRLAQATTDAVDEIGALEADHGVDIGFRRDGWLWTATTPAQLGAYDAALEDVRSRGLTTLRAVAPEQIAARTGSAVHLAGIEEPHAATVHPGKLARALRRIALGLGVRLHEHTRVLDLDRGFPPVLTVPGGRLVADRVVVATNAWAATMPELRPHLFVVGSTIVATAPVPERLAEIGWTGGEAICDSQARVLYYQRTPEGRVVFGRGAGRIAPLGHVDHRFERDPRWARETESALRRVQPALRDVPITHDWAGPVDVSYSSLPLLGRLGGRDHVLYGVGWSGTGVGPSVLGGNILSALALGVEDEWSGCGLVDQQPAGRFPPEPVRSAGAVLVRRAVIRQSRLQDAERPVDAATERLVTLVPGLGR